VSAQVEFTAEELLADHPVTEPLMAGGVRCHGGYDQNGTYVSPRTLHRVPAITAWQEQHREVFGTDVIDVPLETWPVHFPNEAQARFLVGAGVPEPLLATLTRIGTVEGLGAAIRGLDPGDAQRWFDEDIRGTAIAHLGTGLFEAHGRDEAGWEAEAGHRDMWFAARDIAFEGATAKIDVEAMLERMGFGANRSGAEVARLLPDDVDIDLEMIAGFMIRVLLIEVQAFHTFAWAEAWLSDPDLVAGDGAAADLVACIRQDETPHVGYLSTALTEMRDRTWIGTSGRQHAGTDMIGRLWDKALSTSLGRGRDQTRAAVRAEIEHWCNERPHGADIVAEFDSLATPDEEVAVP
jgi:hypothetical protein